MCYNPDDNRHDQFKIAQKVLFKEIMSKERLLTASQKKQTVFDLTSPAKRLATGEIKVVESKMIDATRNSLDKCSKDGSGGMV